MVQPSYMEVYRQLEAAIMRGDLAIDEPLPTEAKLCAMFNVKRSTVREGIRLLEQSGLVRRGNARRLIVSAPDAESSSANVIRSVALNRVTLEELWRVERELDELAARLACLEISDDLLRQLQENLAATRAERGNVKAIVKLDMEFHRLIAQAANNRALAMARDPLGILLYASTDFVITRLHQATDRLIIAHQHIVDAIAAKNTEQASIWTYKHLDDFKRGCIMAGANFDDPIGDFVDSEVLIGMTDNQRRQESLGQVSLVQESRNQESRNQES